MPKNQDNMKAPKQSPPQAASKQNPPKAAPQQKTEAPSEPVISTEQFLAYQRSQMQDGDVLLVANVRVLTRESEICRVNINTTLPMVLTSQQVAAAASLVEDQIYSTILKPIVGVFQERATEATRLMNEEPLLLAVPDLNRPMVATPPITHDERSKGEDPGRFQE